MFVDQARIFVKGGDGGNGIVAFRREKYVPMGGPSGGDGGRGANVILVADEGLKTLMDFKYRRHFKAERGAHGQGKNMHGAWGQDLRVKVPVGTVIKDDESGEVLADLLLQGQEAVVAKGGRGGRGNARFSSAINKAPSFSENGEPGEEKWIRLELKLLADVGLVGFPNAGKSTLISRVSAARPKIADYPFTTLVPNLGVVMTKERDTFVLADIPGLIEGAHQGLGLGHEFLRHIERTRVILFILDAAQTEGRDVVEDYRILYRELELHNPDLLKRPQLIVANKMDIPDARDNARRLESELGKTVHCISAVTGQGVEELMGKTYALLQAAPQEIPSGEEPVVRRFEEELPFKIDKVDGVFEVSGPRIEKLVVMTNFNSDEGLQRFQRTVIKMGLEEALKEHGIKEGDSVRIKDFEFEFTE
ncbi:GTPase ObgE [Syntrophomonas wolfei]|uniref:GTPase Obg n=1 Tax=Syntrophomonas wolfei subsp. wolfei (strain DSM 2245B / Goettingen) TaxID=335541 RepID=OBG_SYNWW|nr:GTPase ObgE [Syntrophomonas wolfei]Q0AWJ4.1 RecName: Full=GTPase Obg; AltName: Full=GTP-binding protein Obg [Syntrophomonas wolfei subsp. wolfei str. Goettingen G311]ABI68910.1 spo0B-associated GTP-binding protein [Syntrophomonas wolfei subsp. wolfei str. Goettingen G311]